MLAAILVSLLIAAPAPARAPSAEAIVRTLYKPAVMPVRKTDLDRIFAHDLATALLKDRQGDGVGDIDFDYRYAAQEVEITALTFQSRAVIGGAVTEVSFRNFGHPTKVTYRLCQRIGGEWRIYQVQAESFDLRRMLKLRSDPVGC